MAKARVAKAMELYMVGVAILIGVLLTILIGIVAFVCFRKRLTRKTQCKDHFETHITVGDCDRGSFRRNPSQRKPLKSSLKKKNSIRYNDNTASSESSVTVSESNGTSISPSHSFTIPAATSPGWGELTLEKPQPSLVPPLSSPKRPSMTEALDPSTLDPSLVMYKERNACLGKMGSLDGPCLGIVNFSLKYNKEMGLLTVCLIQARELQARDFSGTADPYCKISVVPHSTKTLQSKVHKKTQCPEFKESFVFEVPEPDIHRQTVRIYLYDFDQFSRDECIGIASLRLAKLDLSERVEVWKEIKCQELQLRANDETPDLGDLMFSLAYLPSAERLTVVILKARNLRAIKLLEGDKKTSDPYVKVSIFYTSKRLKKKKTSTKHNTVHPVFNEALVFGVTQDFLKHLSLEFQVIHENRIGQNEILGRVVLGPDSQGEELAHWNDMISSSKPVARWHRLVP